VHDQRGAVSLDDVGSFRDSGFPPCVVEHAPGDLDAVVAREIAVDGVEHLVDAGEPPSVVPGFELIHLHA
jgi:hypothetical protein